MRNNVLQRISDDGGFIFDNHIQTDRFFISSLRH